MAHHFRDDEYRDDEYESLHRSRSYEVEDRHMRPPRSPGFHSPRSFESQGRQYLSPDDYSTSGHPRSSRRPRSSSSADLFEERIRESYPRINPARRSADFEQYRQQSKELYMLRSRYQDCTSIAAKISSVCLSKARKEQEPSVGLTFSKIVKRVDTTDFRLREWAMETGIDSVQDTHDDFKETSKMAIDKLNRLESTLNTLSARCSKATSADLVRREDTRSLDSADDISDNEDGAFLIVRVPIGTEIQQLLSSVDTQMQTLSLLSEPLQYSAAKNTFRDTVDVIVAESDRYFGSKEALRRYAVDEKLFGSEAIRAAKDHEETMEIHVRMENFAEPSTKPYLGRGRKTERQDTFVVGPSPHAPVYVKVKKEYVSLETLKYYELPWEVDPHDSEYIIILREMTGDETDILFEHTRRLRQTETVVDMRPAPEERQRYALVRRRMGY